MAGTQPPLEVEMYYSVQRYGVQAVMGRPMGVGEIRLMNYIEQTINEYRKGAANNG